MQSRCHDALMKLGDRSVHTGSAYFAHLLDQLSSIMQQTDEDHTKAALNAILGGIEAQLVTSPIWHTAMNATKPKLSEARIFNLTGGPNNAEMPTLATCALAAPSLPTLASPVRSGMLPRVRRIGYRQQRASCHRESSDEE